MAQPVPRPNLATLVTDLERNGRDLAVVFTRGVREHRVSYSAVAKLARRFAAELENRGIRKGERVLIWGPNCAEWEAAFFGCVLRGVLAVPLDYAGSMDFAARVCDDVRPRLVVGDPQKFASVKLSGLAFQTLGDEITPQSATAIPDLSASDPLQIIFTSGTTGNPKGVVHTHANVLASLEPIEREMGKYLKYERPFHPIRILHTLPLSHVFGQFMGVWTPPLLSAEVHYAERLIARELIEYIDNRRVSVLAAVPRVLDLMQTHLLERIPRLETRVRNAEKFKAWQRWLQFRDVHRMLGLKFWCFVCGGASVGPETEQFWKRLGFVVVQGYGMTETTALVSLNHPFHVAQGTIGRVLPGREVKLAADGEVLVRGSTISGATWQGGHIQTQDSEWLHTGDLAEFDAQGNLKFRGRKKDVIVTAAGLNIYPEDLEAALNSQAGVKVAAVIARETNPGPEPVAVLILKPGTSAESVITAANAELADYQKIRHWQVWDQPDFPRTSTGKILKREILLKPQQPPEDTLDLDSLGRVELQAQVEQQYGVLLNDEDLQKVRTREDVNQLVQRGSSQAAPSPHWYWKFPWSPAVQWLRGVFLEAIAFPILRLLAKPRIARQPSHWPQTPALIISNHITSYDAPFVLFALPGRIRRHVAIAMSGEMLLDYRSGKTHPLSPIAYWLITILFNVFPLPRSVGFRDSFKHAGEAVNRGYNVLVFPEGHRSEDGRPQPFRAGSGLLWKELGIPLIPVRIDGLGELKLRGHGWFRSGSICLTVGEPVPFDPAATPEELTQRMREAVFDSSTPKT